MDNRLKEEIEQILKNKGVEARGTLERLADRVLERLDQELPSVISDIITRVVGEVVFGELKEAGRLAPCKHFQPSERCKLGKVFNLGTCLECEDYEPEE